MTALPLPLLDIVEHLNRVAHHELRRRNLTSLRVHTASPLFEPTSSLKWEPHQGTGLWPHLSTFDYRLPTGKIFGLHPDEERATGVEPATSSLGRCGSAFREFRRNQKKDPDFSCLPPDLRVPDCPAKSLKIPKNRERFPIHLQSAFASVP